MPSKWEGVPINMVPAEERECERTRREDIAEKKRHKRRNVVYSSEDLIVERPAVGAIAKMNTSSPISRGIHDGMMKRPKHVDENVVFAPAGMVGVRGKLPMPIIQSKQESEKTERLRVELNTARKQIELDEQDKEALRETIGKQKKKIADLESRPIVTEEMQLELALYHRAQQKRREREKRFVERHSKD